MYISEKDIFLYVFYPVKLVAEKFNYLEKHYLKFKNEIDLLVKIYKENFKKVDSEIIKNILKKINSYNEEHSYS